MKISAIIPIYNEKKNIEPLYNELKGVLKSICDKSNVGSYEILFVNDGSTDGSLPILRSIAKKDKAIVVLNLRRNFGQTAALRAGFDKSSGDYIVTMDGDLQNDPRDIPRLLKKIDEGYDVVSGWRYKRKDSFGKRILSKIMNNLRQTIIGDRLHDYGCSLKIYRKECVKDLELFGELHRYITAYLYIKGYQIGEIKVNHRQRKAGQTKYKLNRGLNGIFDLFFLKYWSSFSHRPLHLFGRLGLYQWILAILILIEQIIKAAVIGELTFGPLLALSSLLVTTGLLTVIFGFLFEITSRSYFQDHKIYSIRNTFN
jgi:glycosyltransferase involved in cell wall biosynthesis